MLLANSCDETRVPLTVVLCTMVTVHRLSSLCTLHCYNNARLRVSPFPMGISSSTSRPAVNVNDHAQ